LNPARLWRVWGHLNKPLKEPGFKVQDPDTSGLSIEPCPPLAGIGPYLMCEVLIYNARLRVKLRRAEQKYLKSTNVSKLIFTSHVLYLNNYLWLVLSDSLLLLKIPRMIFDVIFILLFCWAAFKGFSKGFILQAASLAALILGIYGSIKFSGYVAAALMERTGEQGQYVPLIAFAITFIAIVVVIHFLARLTEKLLEMIALSFVNRIFGVFFNLIKYAFIISTVLVVLNEIDRNAHFLPRAKVNESRLYKPLSSLAPMIFPYLRFDFNHPPDIPEVYQEEIPV
jgi:membrane protein required for colicin V production